MSLSYIHLSAVHNEIVEALGPNTDKVWLGLSQGIHIPLRFWFNACRDVVAYCQMGGNIRGFILGAIQSGGAGAYSVLLKDQRGFILQTECPAGVICSRILPDGKIQPENPVMELYVKPEWN